LALRLNPGSVFAHAVLGEVHHFYDWDWRAADQEFSTGVGFGSATYGGTRWCCAPRIHLGTISGGGRLHDDFFCLSIRSMRLQFELLEILQYEAGHLREAEAAGRRALEIAPDFTEAGDVLVPILIASGAIFRRRSLRLRNGSRTVAWRWSTIS